MVLYFLKSGLGVLNPLVLICRFLLYSILLQMAIGLALSSSIFVGQALGSGEPSKAIHYGKLCMLISCK